MTEKKTADAAEAIEPDEADVTHFSEDDDPESLVGDEVSE